jgi:hypothetical protein
MSDSVKIVEQTTDQFVILDDIFSVSVIRLISEPVAQAAR